MIHCYAHISFSTTFTLRFFWFPFLSYLFPFHLLSFPFPVPLFHPTFIFLLLIHLQTSAKCKYLKAAFQNGWRRARACRQQLPARPLKPVLGHCTLAQFDATRGLQKSFTPSAIGHKTRHYCSTQKCLTKLSSNCYKVIALCLLLSQRTKPVSYRHTGVSTD